MNKKIVRNTLILLIIPIVITIILALFNQRDTSFKTSVNYDTPVVENYVSNDINEVDVTKTYRKSYTTIIVSMVGLVIIFILFYILLTRKKGW